MPKARKIPVGARQHGGPRPKQRPDDARGGARPGPGPKVADPVGALDRVLRALGRRIADLDGRVNYAARERLFQELDRLHEQMEIALVEAPDYPGAENDLS